MDFKNSLNGSWRNYSDILETGIAKKKIKSKHKYKKLTSYRSFLTFSPPLPITAPASFKVRKMIKNFKYIKMYALLIELLI